jgi:hypothetical protein
MALTTAMGTFSVPAYAPASTPHRDPRVTKGFSNAGFSRIEIRFTPGKDLNATRYGMVQMATSVKHGKPHYREEWLTEDSSINPGNGDPSGRGEGAHIDAWRTSGERSPFAHGSESRSDRGMADHAPIQPRDGKFGGKFGGDAVSTEGQRHFSPAELKLAEAQAVLIDSPNLSDVGPNSEQTFETTCLAMAGEQAGEYYGSIGWGWRIDADGAFTVIEPHVISTGNPSPMFQRAAQIWNQLDGGGTIQLPVPIEQAASQLDTAALVRRIDGATDPHEKRILEVLLAKRKVTVEVTSWTTGFIGQDTERSVQTTIDGKAVGADAISTGDTKTYATPLGQTAGFRAGEVNVQVKDGGKVLIDRGLRSPWDDWWRVTVDDVSAKASVLP